MSEPWQSEQWHVSPFNFASEVRSAVHPPSEVTMVDCTLREGEQQAGVVLRRDEKLRLAHCLDALGIPQLEAGMPAISLEERGTIKAIANAGLRAKVLAIVMANKEDVDRAIDCGVWGVSISVPFGYLQIEHKLRWSHERIVSTAVELSNYAHSQGLFVTMSPYDTTRCDLSFLSTFLSTLGREGHVDRVRLVDTVGSATPETIRFLVRAMKQMLDRPIEVHCHDDFGLAVANTIAGVSAGAEVVSTTLNGMGERAGGAATEEVALALALLYGVKTGLRLEGLHAASALLQELTGVRLQRHKAVVGEGAFAQEAGLVVGGFLRNPFVAQSYNPEVVGQKTNILIGKKSGKHSVKAKLQQLQLDMSDEDVEKLSERIKEEAEQTKQPLSDDRVRELALEVLRAG
ncbi:MAG: hypothetical protein M5U01_04250 [Ardenticatenaceae bacterium]|nr:hypothetical protein [Ardenticatenaceae bacterium]